MAKLEEYIDRRNVIQLQAEGMGKEAGDRIWEMLGVATRHIQRVVYKKLPFSVMMAEDMERCFARAEKELVEMKNDQQRRKTDPVTSTGDDVDVGKNSQERL